MNDSKVFYVFGFRITVIRLTYVVATRLEGRQVVHFDHFSTLWAAKRFARKSAYANSLNFDLTVTSKVFFLDPDDFELKFIREYRAVSERKVKVM